MKMNGAQLVIELLEKHGITKISGTRVDKACRFTMRLWIVK